MYKLGHQIAGNWVEHSHPPVFALQSIAAGHPKLLATAPGGDPLIFETLAARLTPPYFFLYLLHTPRGEGEPGRYQSGELDEADVQAFLDRFGDFLSKDARFDLWLHSPADNATIVWDRHDLIHGYGRTEDMVEALRGLGFHSGTPAIPSPHAHNYHTALDADARALLDALEWTWSPLRPGDEQ